ESGNIRQDRILLQACLLGQRNGAGIDMDDLVVAGRSEDMSRVGSAAASHEDGVSRGSDAASGQLGIPRGRIDDLISSVVLTAICYCQLLRGPMQRIVSPCVSATLLIETAEM